MSNGQPPLFDHPEYTTAPIDLSKLLSPRHEPADARIFQISQPKLKQLKDRCSNEILGSEGWISTNDAICALLWQRITMARSPSPNKTTKLVLSSNVRSLLGLPPGYFGNAVFNAGAVLTVEEATSWNIGKIAKLIRRKLNLMGPEFVQSALNFIGSKNPGTVRCDFTGPEDFFITNWNKFPINDMEFGSGKPIFVGAPPFPVPGIGIAFESAINELGFDICLNASEMKALLSDLVFSSYFTVTSYSDFLKKE
jgi:hypothetical protein